MVEAAVVEAAVVEAAVVDGAGPRDHRGRKYHVPIPLCLFFVMPALDRSLAPAGVAVVTERAGVVVPAHQAADPAPQGADPAGRRRHQAGGFGLCTGQGVS